VGNGVPVPMAAAVAQAIRVRGQRSDVRLCLCECGRPVTGNQIMATPACRKRMERKRASMRHSESAASQRQLEPKRESTPPMAPRSANVARCSS
jgi:hypothetical protein